MKKMLLISTVLFLLAAITYGQASAISRAGKSSQRYQAKTTIGTLQHINSTSINKTSQNNNPAVNPILPNSPVTWVTNWSFLQSSGTYTAISGGTVLGTTANDENVFGPYNIGFNFEYNGTVYTQFSVATNGFIGLGGAVVTTSALPISGTGSNNVISALGIDLKGQTGSTLQYLMTGSSPARTLVVQWTNYMKGTTIGTGDIFNFQIKLTETSNSIAFVYNAFTVNGTNGTVQVGLRGASSADYNNRAVTTGTWAASTAGTSNTASCRLRTATKPANGQTYTWTPLVCNNINTFPYNENFSATLNPCWSITQVALTGLWTMATSINYPDLVPIVTLSPQSGTHLAKFDSYNFVANTSSRLATVTFDFTTLTSPSVEFYMAQDAEYTNLDMVEIQASINGGASWTTVSTPFYRYNTSFTAPGWQKYTAYLPAYAGTNNVKLAFLATSLYGNMMAIDNVTVKQGLTDDVGTAGIFAPTKLPKGQAYKWWSFIKNYGPNTETFDVDTKLRVNTTPTVTTTNTVTALTFNSLKTLSGSYSLSSYASGSSFDILNQTKLATDQNTSNDIFINSARACTTDTVYAWDDGVAEGSVGYNTGLGWLGQVYYLSVQDTLTSITIQWGTLPLSVAGNSLEIYNIVGGVPTTKFGDIVTGINLTTANQNATITYKPTSPIILPAGAYWIGAHQSVAAAGTYLLSTDETDLTTDNFLTGFAFYSGDGAAWTDYATSGLNSINRIRPNFANIIGVFVANPTNFTATPASSSAIDLSWALNANSNNVLVAWNTTNTFGTPSGGAYVAGSTISGVGTGTVLQFNNYTTFHHGSLSSNTVYYYKVWSYNGSVYSGGTTANAQTFCAETPAPWTENFELATFPPSCWDINSGSAVWARSIAASGYGTGTASAFADFFSTSGATPFALFSLPFNGGTLAAPMLSFDYAYATYATEVDEMDVYYSIDGGLTFLPLFAMPGGPTGILNTGGVSTTAFVPTAAQWRTQTRILPLGTNMVAFNAISAYGNNLYLDNIKIIEGPLHDVGIGSLNPVDVFQAGTFSPVATISNFAGSTETFPVTMTIGSYMSTKTVTALGPGLSQLVTFDPWSAPIGTYTMTVTTNLSGDLVPANNTASKAIKVMTLNKEVYGYTTFTATDNGPIKFNLNNPGTITEIVNDYPATYPGAGTWANGTWYAAIYSAATPFNLVTFNTTTGARTVVGNMGVNINAMSYNTLDSKMYGAGYDGTNSALYTINLTTGVASLVGTIGTQLIINMAINNAGVCYATDLSSDVLGKINLATGAFTAVGPIGFGANYAQDMEFDRGTGELYMAAYGSTGQLRWVDQTTGNTMLIGDFQYGSEVTGFAIPYSTTKTLNLSSVLLEGLYNGLGIMNKAYDENGPHFQADTADMITVELHNNLNYANIKYSTPAALSTTGTSTVLIPSEWGDNYYLTIKHRNSIETTSALPVDFSGAIISYAFDTQAQAYGSNMGLMIDGSAVIFAGDEDQSGLVDGTDLSDIGNLADAAIGGYLPQDINGDGLVDGGDLSAAGNNSDYAIGAVLP